VLIFILQFFPWVGIYPGGVPAVRQDAWDAAFGLARPDVDMGEFLAQVNDEAGEGKEGKAEGGGGFGGHGGLLSLFHPFPFFPPPFLSPISVPAEPFLNLKLPPQVQQVMPWKWAILAGLNAVLLLFLGLQLLLNFEIESKVKQAVENRAEVKQ